MLAPWLLRVQLSEGVVVYFERRLDFSIALGLTDTRPSLLELTLPFTPRESLLWLWGTAMLTPPVALILAWKRGESRPAILAVLMAVTSFGLMRRPGQAAYLAPLWIPLLIWCASQARVLGGLVLALCVIAVAQATDAGSLYQIAIDNGGLVGRPISALQFHLRTPPIEAYAPADVDDERLLVRYLHACVPRGHRIWDTAVWFPLAYYAERPLVDHPYWSMGFRRDQAAQALTLASLEDRPAPVIVVRGLADAYATFHSYAKVSAYVRAHYRPLTSETFAPFSQKYAIQLLADTRTAEVGRFSPLDLPCFAAAVAVDQ